MAGTYAAAELPDIRSRLIADLSRPERGNAVLETYALHAGIGRQVLADPAELGLVRQARLLIRAELQRLRGVALYWVSPPCHHSVRPGGGDHSRDPAR